jgi:PRTRC genetic system protein B
MPKVTPYIGDASVELKLGKALLIYCQPEADVDRALARYIAEGVMPQDAGETAAPVQIVSIHDIARKGKGVCLGPGQLLERERLDEVLRSLQSAPDTRRQLIPPGMLFGDNSMLLWYAPACTREIYFSTADKEFQTDVSGKKVAHPPLLFMAKPSLLSVWALSIDTRPDSNTVAQIAPYYNLYGNASMCRGDVKLPSTLLPSTIPEWEKIFYDSRFTHSNLHSGKSTTHKGGHHGLWREMVAAQAFDSKYLVATKLTVGDILAGKTEP